MVCRSNTFRGCSVLQGEPYYSFACSSHKAKDNLCRPDISKTLLRYLQDIVVSLVEESPTLPDGVLDFILSQVKAYQEVSATPHSEQDMGLTSLQLASGTTGIRTRDRRYDRGRTVIPQTVADGK